MKCLGKPKRVIYPFRQLYVKTNLARLRFHFDTEGLIEAMRKEDALSRHLVITSCATYGLTDHIHDGRIASQQLFLWRQ